MNKEKYAFPYLGHGIGYNRKCLECYIWFKDEVKTEDRKKIERSTPPPLACFFYWCGKTLHFGSDDFLEVYIRETYNKKMSSILNSGNEELIEKFHRDADDGKYGDYINPTNKEWKKFNKAIHKWIENVNKNNPVAFFLKPVGEYGTKFSKYHNWSVSVVPERVLPCLFEFYKNPPVIESCKKDSPCKGGGKLAEAESEAERKLLESIFDENCCCEDNDGEDNRMGIPSWILNDVLALYLDSYDFDSIPSDVKNSFVDLLQKSFGFDDYIDKHNLEMLVSLLSKMRNDHMKAFEGVAPEVIIQFFSTCRNNSLLLLDYDEPIAHLKGLLEKIPEDKRNPNEIIEMGNNIAGIGFINKTIDEISSEDVLIASQIYEICFDMPDCPNLAFINAGTTYSKDGNWNRVLEISRAGLERFKDDAMILTNALWASIKLKRDDLKDIYMKASVGQALNDPDLLVNVLCVFNTSKEFEPAVELVDKHREAGGEMRPKLYINMMSTYIGVERFDVLEEFLQEVLNILESDRDYFKHDAMIYHNIACAYARTDRKEKAIEYIKTAKENNYFDYDAIKDDEDFESMKDDDDFLELFDNQIRR